MLNKCDADPIWRFSSARRRFRPAIGIMFSKLAAAHSIRASTDTPLMRIET
jgi:hypothetical protein